MLSLDRINSLMTVYSLWVCCSLIQAQSIFHGDNGFQKIVYNEKIYTRDINTSDCFSPSRSPIVGTNAPNGRIFADSMFIYRYYSTAKRDLVAQYGFLVETEAGARWNWSPQVLLPESSNLLTVDDLTVFYAKREIRNNSKFIIIESINLATSRSMKILEKQHVPYLTVQATQLDGKIYIIWNDGGVYSIQSDGNNLVDIDPGFLERLLPDRVTEISTDAGKELQPLTFLGQPTVSPSGNVLFFFSVREKEVWNREQLDQMWADSSTESKNYQLKNGLWPPKNWTFEGSDYNFRGFEINVFDKKVELVRNERLMNVTVKSKYHDSRKVKDQAGIYAVNKNGEVMDLASLICKETLPVPAVKP